MQLFPSLTSLDLSFGHLVDLGDTFEALEHLPKLSALSLAGNPLALRKQYRIR
jgi:Leucine-rich repeat (LRR) protein